MADGENVAGKIGLDTTDWKTGISEINRDVRVIESGFKAVAAGMDDWKNSADGLTQRNNALSEIIGKQKEKVALLEGEYERMKKAAEENGDTTSKTANALAEFEIRINKAREQLAKSETELRKNAAALADMEKDADGAADSAGRLSQEMQTTSTGMKTLGDRMKTAASTLGSAFVTAAKAAAAAIAAVAAAAAGAVKSAVTLGSDYDKAMGIVAAKTGAAGDQLKEFGDIATRVYGNNFGDSLEDVAEGMSAIEQNTGLAGAALQQATEAGFALRDTFGFELAESSRTAAALMKNLNITAEEAYNIIATGAQNGADKNGDLLDTLNEYSVQYDKLGLSAEQMMQSLISGAENGAFSIDKVGDAVKEFSIRATDGSDTSRKAFEALGLNADTMFAQFAAGGDSAQKAFFQVVQKIQSLNDPLKQAEIGVGLFGTQFEDLGAGVFPILQSMQGELTSTAGALDGINAVKYDNAADAMNGLKRTVEANLLPLAGKASDAFKQFAQDATKALQDGFQPDDIAVIVDSFKDNLLSLLDMADKMMPTISAAISEIMRELVSILPSLINTLLPAAMALLESLVDGIVANIGPITECAVSLVMTLATGIVSALPKLIPALIEMVSTIASTIWDAVKKTDWGEVGKNILQGVVEGMKAIFGSVKKAVTGFFSDIWQGVRDTLGIHSPSTKAAEDGKNMLYGFQNGANAAKASVGSDFKTIFSGIWNGVKTDLNDTTAASYARTLIQGVSTGLNAMKTSVTNTAKTVGSEICNGINRGLNSGENSIITAAKNVAMSAINAAKKALGIRSPSRVMEEQVGLPTVQGIAQGVTKNSRILRDSITEATSGMKGAKINPVSMPVAATNQVSQPVIVRAVLKLRETEFGELVTTLADSGQGFKSSNIVRREMGVQFA